MSGKNLKFNAEDLSIILESLNIYMSLLENDEGFKSELTFNKDMTNEERNKLLLEKSEAMYNNIVEFIEDSLKVLAAEAAGEIVDKLKQNGSTSSIENKSSNGHKEISEEEFLSLNINKSA